MAGFYDGMLPEVPLPGHIGYYPVCNAEEWDNLPALYKAMEWFPVDVYNPANGRRETTVAEYVEFDVVYLEPYKIHAKVLVNVADVQKIMFCLYDSPQCHLYSISGVVFANGVRYNAKWMQDTTTGAFGVYACGKRVGEQGGYVGFVPSQIERTSDGFKWKGYTVSGIGRCHYEVNNPFE